MDKINGLFDIERLDRLLNELERFANVELRPLHFYRELLRRLNHVLGSRTAWIVQATSESQWSVLAVEGPPHEGDESAVDACQWLASQSLAQQSLQGLNAETGIPFNIAERDSSGVWLGASLRAIGWISGGIIVRLPSTIPPASESGLSEILSAFSEIADKYQQKKVIERLDRLNGPLRSIANEIQTSPDKEISARNFVNGACLLLDADRVSLLETPTKNLSASNKVLAISHAVKVDPSVPIVEEILRAFRLFPNTANPNQVLEALSIQQKMAATIAIPLAINRQTVTTRSPVPPIKNQYLLLIQWADSERYQGAASAITDVVPWLSDAWGHNQTTLRVPSRVRSLFDRVPSWTHNVKRLLLLLGAVATLLFFSMTTQLTIRSRGTLEPTNQRFIFAPADGYVDEIFVTDGQLVEQGQPIAKLASPSLQLELGRIDSEIRLVDEMRVGLDVTINQLPSNDDQAIVLGSQLAGEVKELEKKRESLVNQRELLKNEQLRLELLSPIDGTVISWDIEKQLDSRPVKLGDTLFRIAELSEDKGQWRIEVPVVDWESGYVSEALRDSIEADTTLKVTFALPTSPRQTWRGTVNRSALSLHNDQGSQHLDFFISLDQAVPSPRIGTSAIVSFSCGNYRRWFVWSRTIIDAIHRRFWF